MRFVTLLFFLLPLSVAAQSPVLNDTITWTSGDDQNLSTGDSFTRSFSFVTRGSSSIDFVAAARTRHFVVSSVSGSWADLTQQGELVFSVLLNSMTGEIRLGRSDAATSPYLIVDMTSSSPSAMHSKFTIDHFTR